MIFLYIMAVIGLIVVIGGALDVRNNRLKYRKVYSLTPQQYKELSWPAVQIMKVHTALPESNRPKVDMVSMLRALDTKNGGEAKVTEHFEYNVEYNVGYGSTTEYRWEGHGSSYSRCGVNSKCAEYKEILEGLQEIAKALAEQEHKILMAGIAFQLETAESMADMLREEAELVRKVTKEITS